MKSIILLALLLSTSAYCVEAQAATGAGMCCSSAKLTTAYGRNLADCSMTKCTTAMALNNHMSLNEFLAGCLQVQASGDYTLIEETMSCAAPFLPRRAFVDFAFSIEESDNPTAAEMSAIGARRMQGNLAAVVLGYGCQGNATTAGCSNLDPFLRTQDQSGTPGILGLAPNAVTEGVLTMRLNINQAIYQCVAQDLDSFQRSEWNGGMSQCAAVADSGNADSLAEYAANLGTECRECVPSGNDQPFCGDFMNAKGTSRFGTRCHRAQIADRLTRTLARQAHRTNTYRLTSSIKVTNLKAMGSVCLGYLQSLTCHIMFGACSANEVRVNPCQNECQSVLTSSCGLSQTDAATACREVNADNTDATICPAPPTTVAPTTDAATTPAPTTAPASAELGPEPEPLKRFVLATATNMRNHYNLTFCLNEAQTARFNAGVVQAGLQGLFVKICSDVLHSDSCALTNYTSERTKFSCGFRVVAIVETQSTVQTNATTVKGAAQMDTSAPSNGLQVHVVQEPANVVQAATTGGSNGSPANTAVASATLLSGAVLAAIASMVF